ncbi:MAG: site-specific integrase [Patescibacteria group bacterium]
MKKDIKVLFSEFIKECRHASRLSSETIRGYEHAFKLILSLYPDLDCDSVTPQVMTRFFEHLNTRQRLVGRGDIRTGVRKSTVATYRSKLYKFFEWLKRYGHIKENPFRLMEYPDVQYEDRKYLSKDDVEKIFTTVAFHMDWKNTLVKKRNILIFQLLLSCGLRKGELLALKLLDIDFERKILTVQAETSKSKRKRLIPLNQKVLLDLKDYVEERKRRGKLTSYLLASANEDARLTAAGLKHLIEHVKKESGVKFHIHQMRHTFAVNLMYQGTDMSKVKQLMGYKDIRMTAAYLRVLPPKAMQGDVEALTLENLI